MTANNISQAIRYLLLLVCWTWGTAIWANTPVSFLANIDPGSSQTTFTVKVGSDQITSVDLNHMLRPGGGRTLTITSIHGTLSDELTTPTNPDCALISLGILKQQSAIRGLGADTLVLTGDSISRIDFDPGLAVSLLPDESLALRSQAQSSHSAVIEVHGFLENQP